MILQSLAKLAEHEHLLQNPAYEQKPVDWVINVDGEGRFLGLETLIPAPEPGAKSRASRRGPSLSVPRPRPGAKRTGIAPDPGFLVDNAAFSLGIDLTEDQKIAQREGELARRLDGFCSLVENAAERTADPGSLAVAKFLRSTTALQEAAQVVRERCDGGEFLSNHLLGFRLSGGDGGLVHQSRQIITYWSNLREAEASGADRRQCLASGELAAVIDKHPLLKRVPGESPSGVSLVSFNDSAYESYGLSRNENAPVSRSVAEAYTTALNRLLDPATPDPHNPKVALPEQRVVLSGDTVAVFWTDQSSRIPGAIAPAVGEGSAEAAAAIGVDVSWLEVAPDERGDPDAESARSTYEAVWRGIDADELYTGIPFQVLILSGAQGRATIRAFHRSTVATTVTAIRQWFVDVRLVGYRGRPALRRLLRSLAVRGEDDNLPPNLAGNVFMAILTGRQLPAAVLEMAVRRFRSDPRKHNPDRTVLVKAYLNRARGEITRSQNIRFQEVQPDMNESERNQGYLLGRLFACAERMQELALGDVGASITDRYFAAACATPQAVFPRLLKSEVHHFRKARDGKYGGSARWLHGQIDQICTWLVGERNGMADGEAIEEFLKRTAGRALTGFPAFLPLAEQGLFTLGYHQQRAEFFKKREKALPATTTELGQPNG